MGLPAEKVRIIAPYGGGFGGRSVNRQTVEAGGALIQELKGVAAHNPELVPRRLEEMAKGPAGAQGLITLARMTAYPDPDLSGIALEVARETIAHLPSLLERVNARTSMTAAASGSGPGRPGRASGSPS